MKLSKQDKFRKQFGFSLVEALLSAAVLGVVAMISANLIVNVINAQEQTQLSATRDRLVREVAFGISNLKSYPYSIANDAVKNRDMDICINGDTSATTTPKLCTALTAPKASGGVPVKVGFVLYPPLANKPISGTPDAPLTYTKDGVQCSTNDNQINCPLSVETWFQADCSGGVDCSKASDIQFFYKISGVGKFILKPATNELLPSVYSSLLATSMGEVTAAVEETASSPTVQGPSVQCFNTPKTTYNGSLTNSTTCCMTIGSETRCKETSDMGSGVAGLSFSNAFGKWDTSGVCGTKVTAGMMGLNTCSDFNAACVVGTKCAINKILSCDGKVRVYTCVPAT